MKTETSTSRLPSPTPGLPVVNEREIRTFMVASFLTLLRLVLAIMAAGCLTEEYFIGMSHWDDATFDAFFAQLERNGQLHSSLDRRLCRMHVARYSGQPKQAQEEQDRHSSSPLPSTPVRSRAEIKEFLRTCEPKLLHLLEPLLNISCVKHEYIQSMAKFSDVIDLRDFTKCQLRRYNDIRTGNK
ncbi:hypothetical protein C8J56DRAFT_264352 [Mycena floridula]|nr:hypothetical protein C8J56DRAFT_264352 [Mycena floridula]